MYHFVQTETLYQHDNAGFGDSSAMPSLTPLKFSDNSRLIDNDANTSAKKDDSDFVLNTEELPKPELNSPKTPTAGFGVSTMSPTHEMQSPKSPPIPTNALEISPQHQTQPHPSSPKGILLSPQQQQQPPSLLTQTQWQT